jgi:predicted HNH restriction endonuclease
MLLGRLRAFNLTPSMNVTVHYDIAADFAVLCSNCHRMIHRTADPSNLAQFRDMVQSNKV